MNMWAIGTGIAGLAGGFAIGSAYGRRSVQQAPPPPPEPDADPWADIDYGALARTSAEGDPAPAEQDPPQDVPASARTPDISPTTQDTAAHAPTQHPPATPSDPTIEPPPARDVTFIQICVDIADRLRDAKPALWERLNEQLTKAGVDVVIPDGGPFDPEEHDSVGRQPTDDPALHLTVAETMFAGYRDRGTWLRRPEVIVYVKEGAAI